MSNMTTKERIIDYLKGKDWQYGGSISTEVARQAQCKASVVERRCRELERSNMLESRYIDNPNGHGNKVVQYRVRPIMELPQAYDTRKPEVDNKQQPLF